MADKKITDLPASQTYDGIEKGVIVQSGETRQTDIGTVASKDHGVATTEVPLNSDLGSMATQNADNVAITGGSVTGVTGSFKEIGEIFTMIFRKAISAAFPNLLLTDESRTLSETNYPDFISLLRAELVYVGSTSSFSGSASGSVITLDDNADNVALVTALAEDQLVEATYTNWRTITWGGSDYPITDVDPVTRAITVTGTPTAGAGNATLHPYRISGSTTTARLLKADGLVLATAGASGTIAGLRTRDQMQGWQSVVYNGATGYYGYTRLFNYRLNGVAMAGRALLDWSTTQQGNATRVQAGNDGTNGDPRTGTTTRERRLGVYTYVYVGTYVA